MGKHFFLGVLSENGTSEKAEQWVGRLDAFAPGESSKMKNHACASLRNILRSTVVPKTAKALIESDLDPGRGLELLCDARGDWHTYGARYFS